MHIGWVSFFRTTKYHVVNHLFAAELGSVFYSAKERNFDDRGNRRKADKEFSKKAELEMEMEKQREECVKNVGSADFHCLYYFQGRKTRGTRC